MNEDDIISLATVAKGAAIERVDDEMKRVLENILDPNTGLSAREITLKIKITPNDTRDACAVQLACTSKLTGAKAVGTTIYIGRGGGGIQAKEFNPNQLGVPFTEEAKKDDAKPNLHSLTRAQA